MTSLKKNNSSAHLSVGTDVRSNKKIFLNYQDRLEHTLVLGKTGAGKLYHTIIPMIKHDITNEDSGVIVLESKGEIAESANSIAIFKNREVIYFNPLYENCPTFNPLYGEEETAIVNLSGAFKTVFKNQSPAILKINLAVLSRCIKVVKRLYGNEATLSDIHLLLTNINGAGVSMLHDLMDKENDNELITQENAYNCDWFISYYKGEKIGGIDIQKYSLLLKYEISKIINNKFLKNTLNPKRGCKPDIIFSEAIKDKKVIAITTSKGHLRELETTLRYLFMYQLQSEINKTDKCINETNHTMIYLDEAQSLLNEDLVSILGLCKNKSIGLILSGQSPQDSIKELGEPVAKYIFKSCKNKFIYPYMDEDDYGDLLNVLNFKDIVIARNKFRNVHYSIEKDFGIQTGIIEVDAPDFNEEYMEIEKIRSNYTFNNKTLFD